MLIHAAAGLTQSASCLRSSEPAVPGDEEEAATASPDLEPEVEKEVEAAGVELKPETMLETQTDGNTDDQTEKSPTAAPPTAEPAPAPTEPTPAAPEENRVGLNPQCGLRAPARRSDPPLNTY